MNEADSSPGGGAVQPTTTAAPASGATAAPAAAGATPDPTMVQAIAAALQPMLRDGLFAELRRSGALGPNSRPNRQQQQAAPAGEPAAAAAAPNSGEPAGDPSRLRTLDRALNRTGYASRLNSDAAYQRVERAFAAENPENVTEWVREYFEGMGITAGTQAASAASTPAPATPGSNPGQPAAPAGAPTTPAAPAAPAAPRAPASVNPMESGGLVDIWNLSLDQLVAMGPEGVRQHHERALAQSNARSGAPPVPRVLQRR